MLWRQSHESRWHMALNPFNKSGFADAGPAATDVSGVQEED
jgi:hypothetical protein